MATRTKGACMLCGKDYTKAGMTRHIATCLTKHIESKSNGAKGKKEIFTHLVVTAPGMPEYWLHVLMDCNDTLEALDGFLRGIWLECCGHLSAFTTGHYNEVRMKTEIGRVLTPDIELQYQYDFGSTTDLKVKSLAEYEVPAKLFDPLELFARNDDPQIPCSNCGKPAEEICTQCMWEGPGWLCEACARKHTEHTGCEEDMRLPVVNSPRTGVCGYSG